MDMPPISQQGKVTANRDKPGQMTCTSTGSKYISIYAKEEENIPPHFIKTRTSL